MCRRLRLALWPHLNAAELDDIETGVLLEFLPPLNLSKVATRWRDDVKAARKVLASEARAWRPEPLAVRKPRTREPARTRLT